ncbi:MAG: recombinase family protein [Candidatus Lokiarchaeota archaeon]|nr:recombinase family protein [Candidatus Lokiarchaeota archaeon]
MAMYARVSAAKQKEDLVRQAEFLREKAREQGYPHVLVYKDIASGLKCRQDERTPVGGRMPVV